MPRVKLPTALTYVRPSWILLLRDPTTDNHRSVAHSAGSSNILCFGDLNEHVQNVYSNFEA
eukprot:scaffold4183_cov137-Cylindrotheca_fusiformis.AAC.3